MDCKICSAAPAELPVGAPDMCRACNEAAWERIAAKAAAHTAVPGNEVTNVWN